MMQQKTFEGFDASVSNKAQLEAQFIVPPFSVLDTRQGYWQERKRRWVSLGIKGEEGRDARAYSCNDGAVTKYDYLPTIETGTSIFDPVLCELVYKWFCPEAGQILDPFAGGSVRGIVASVLGYGYTGIDLSQRQVGANIGQAQQIVPDKEPAWIVGDSHDIDTLLPEGSRYDLVFSCPPYHNLEQYTDDPADLSNMSWRTFKDRYRVIIERCVLRLNSNRFACFVVSEIRDGNGSYKGLVPYTIDCFVRAGAWYYNEAILVNTVGSLPVRIANQFTHRKIGRTHQNILIFYKGDMEQIPRHFKGIDASWHYGDT